MKTMTLIAATTLGVTVMAGGAFAAPSGHTMSTRHTMRPTVQQSERMQRQDDRMSTRSSYGAPARRTSQSRNSTQNATPEAGSSGSLVMPGSGSAIYSYDPNDKNRQYGY